MRFIWAATEPNLSQYHMGNGSKGTVPYDHLGLWGVKMKKSLKVKKYFMQHKLRRYWSDFRKIPPNIQARSVCQSGELNLVSPMWPWLFTVFIFIRMSRHIQRLSFSKQRSFFLVCLCNGWYIFTWLQFSSLSLLAANYTCLEKVQNTSHRRWKLYKSQSS